ncbi:hypothetical protein FIU84_03175 [Stutzerimonas frequens]|uniref:hypothetical protein n=1 Tax=Stutzerimonas frequens TaxID=2968969 RepID=UPI0012680F3E|nr:hypothetical protein [Stutzerimonas frequens]QFU11004.1 hypothetical protein FIU84_03175 [Stutzerimonas frequens]|tara:strand:+ start:410 stop:817 length:408 start_codon:yes stop_codon:yes gene_type:complete
MKSNIQHDKFDIRKSSKAYIEAEEHYIVIHNGTVYLRVVGQEGAYAVMTATSGEDMAPGAAFSDQQALNDAARGVAKLVGCVPELKYDYHHRPYVKICECEYLSDVYRAAAGLFELLEASPSHSNRAPAIPSNHD